MNLTCFVFCGKQQAGNIILPLKAPCWHPYMKKSSQPVDPGSGVLKNLRKGEEQRCLKLFSKDPVKVGKIMIYQSCKGEVLVTL